MKSTHARALRFHMSRSPQFWLEEARIAEEASQSSATCASSLIVVLDVV